MILETVNVGPMQVNCYILASGINSLSIIVDPGDDAEKIKRVLNKHKLKPAFIINTHGHYDHIGSDDKFDVPVYIQIKDLELLKEPKLNLSKIKPLQDNEVIELEALQLKVIHTPGHTPGSISLLLEKPQGNILFTGDALFCQGIGRTDFPGGDETLLIKSIKEKLFPLSDGTAIYPGHGPSSTIGKEKKSNPFLIENAGIY